MTRVCKRCHIEQSIEVFYVEKMCKGGRRPVCAKCIRKQQKERYAKNPEKGRTKQREYNRLHPENNRKCNLKKKYGITKEYYNLIFQQQGGVCLVCGKSETVMFRGKIKYLAVDHNHQTGKIRGLLCQKCNQALGLLGENPVIIKSLLGYLKECND